MSIADFLKGVGGAAATAGKVAGAVLEPVGKAVAEEESGQLPEIEKEKRARKFKGQDEELARKTKFLENQLALDEKYGTLTPEQRTQLKQEYASLGQPKQETSMIQKLHKAIHPGGATYQQPAATLKDATPEGGTAKADAALKPHGLKPLPGVKPFKDTEGRWLQPMIDLQGNITNEEVPDYVPPAQKPGAGKSPPLPGNQLPPDAVGANGQPIPTEDRNAGKSFVQYHDEWWPVAKAKPVFKTVKGHSVLVDSQSGAILRDLGPSGTAKVTTHQSLQPGDDGQMHMVTLTSVTTPEGAKIDVEPETAGEAGESKPAEPTKPKSVGNLIKPHTGAKPVQPTNSSGGAVVPGFSNLAASKDPLHRADIATYKKAHDDVVVATKLSSLADQVAANPHDAINQKRLAVALEKLSAGRFTTQALDFVMKSGWGNTLQQWANNPSTGELPPEVMRQLIDGAHQNLKAAQEALKSSVVSNPSSNSPKDGDTKTNSSGDKVVFRGGKWGPA